MRQMQRHGWCGLPNANKGIGGPGPGLLVLDMTMLLGPAAARAAGAIGSA